MFKILAKIGVLVAVVVLVATSNFTSADSLKSQQTMTELSGTQVRACAAAFEDFKQRGYPLEHYKVVISEKSSKYEIVFVPDHPSDKPTTRGGATIYGKEIRYTILESGVIESISYAR
jgi:hypothetical protein